MNAGAQLRSVREHLGLTLRDVEAASLRIATQSNNAEFAIPYSRLSEIETKGVIPSIHRLYSLSAIYRRDLRELLSWYAIHLENLPADLQVTELARTHKLECLDPLSEVRMPVKLDPAFDVRKTCDIGRFVEKWGTVPLTFLQQFAESRYTFAYIGGEDFTMYPILLPGSFVQVDESRIRVEMQMWASEYERPIYFVETREGYVCSWCELQGENLILQPHPRSPVPVRLLKHPQEAEVIGQVVGIAMRLGEWFSPAFASERVQRVPTKLP
jgi:transcriptional regulator with XRE-family HTH domain